MLKKGQVVILSDNQKYVILKVFKLKKDIVYLAMTVSDAKFCLLKEFDGGLVFEEDEKNVLEIVRRYVKPTTQK